MSAVAEWMLARPARRLYPAQGLAFPPPERRIVAGVDMTGAPPPPEGCDRLEDWPEWVRRRDARDDIRDLQEQENVLGHDRRNLHDGPEKPRLSGGPPLY